MICHRGPGFLALLGLLSAAVLSAATAGPVPVRGRVVDADGRPVAGAEVRLAPRLDDYHRGRLALATGTLTAPPVARARTAADGGFALAAPAGGHYKIDVRAPGCVRMAQRLEPLLEDLDLEPVTLPADAGLTVEVVDADGRPVPAAWVYAVSRLNQEPGRRSVRWQPAAAFVRTGDDGRARVERPADLDEIKVRAWAAGFLESAVAEPAAGTVRLTLEPGRPLMVEVHRPAGRPWPQVLVNSGDWGWPGGLTGEDGRFTVAAAAGRPLAVELVTPGGWGWNGKLVAEPDDRREVVELPPPLELSGSVVDRVSREPVAGAVVWMHGGSGAWVLTGADGSFRLETAPAKGGLLRAAAAGYRMESSRFDGEALPQLTVALSPTAGVAGRVVDGDGEPVAGAEVVAGPGEVLAGGRGEQDPARSDADGRFRLRDLLPETPYTLVVAAAGFAPSRQTVSTPERGEGEEVVVTLRRGRRGFGRVVDLDGQPVAGAEVLLAPQDGERMAGLEVYRHGAEPAAGFRAAAGEDGGFELPHLPAGSYDLQARASGFAPLAVPGIELPEGEGESDLGTVVLEPGAAIEGRVVDGDERPIEGAQVHASTRTALFSSFDSGGYGGPPQAVSGPDGRFRVPDLRSGGTFELTVERSGYVQRQVPGVTAPTAEPLTITLVAAARVSGRVLGPDLRPLEGSWVLALPGGPGGAFDRRQASTVTDEDGRFTLEGLEAGEVTLTARAEGRAPRQRQAVVAAGQHLEGVDIVLAPGSALRGQVLDEERRPVAGATVSLTRGGDPWSQHLASAQGSADPAGRYRIEGLEPGPHQVEAWRGDGASLQRSVEIEPGDNLLDLIFELSGVAVEGVVLAEGGGPVAAAEVVLSSLGPLHFHRRVRSSGDGVFSFTGVPGGLFQLQARGSGYAPASQPLEVGEGPVRGLELRLSAGGTISGRILGLALEELSRVEVTVQPLSGEAYPGEVNRGRVSYEGAYRIERVPAGEWRVAAFLTDPMRIAFGEARLAGAGDEAVVDLEFQGGLTLTGTVLAAGEPAPGLLVQVQGTGVPSVGAARTDHLGRFHVTGLQPGRHRVAVIDLGRGVQMAEELDLTGDREVTLELSPAGLSGRVIDASSGEPLPGAQLRLEPADPELGFSGLALLRPPRTDARGEFALEGVAPGRYRLLASLNGYGSSVADLELPPGARLGGVELRLEPTAGLAVEVRTATASPPPEVWVALVDAAGATVLGGNYSPGPAGRIHLATAPAGRWRLLAAAQGTATAAVAVTVPGEPVVVALPAAGHVALRVPAAATGTVTPQVTAVGPDGEPYRTVSWGGRVATQLPVYLGRVTLSLPAGIWLFAVAFPDGPTLAGSAGVTAGQTTELTVE